MNKALIVVLFAFWCHVTRASEDEKLTKILDRLEKLETENKKKDKIISDLIEKTKYCSFGDDTEHQGLLRPRKRLLNSAAPGEPPVFHARLSHDLHSIGTGQPIVFNLELVDTTNAYEHTDGIFTAPLTGIYVFYWNLLTMDADGMDTTLDSSHGPLGFGYVSHAVSFGSGGNLVIARLAAGTHVWVKKADHYGNSLHERFSTFSGYLLTVTD